MSKVQRFKTWANKPIVIRRGNGYAVVFWMLLIVPTLTLWKHSVLWVAILSIWANVISHYTAWMTGRVEVRAEDVQESLQEHATIAHIEQLGETILVRLEEIAHATG